MKLSELYSRPDTQAKAEPTIYMDKQLWYGYH